MLALMQILTLSKMQIPPVRWLVPNWLGRDALTLLIGAGGASKSWASLDLAIALASQQSWLGQATSQARVLYIDEDGQIAETYRRLIRLCAGRSLDPASLDSNLFIAPAQGLKVDQAAQNHDLILTSLSLKVDLVIIDALVAIHSADENDNKAMGYVMRGLLRNLMRETKAGILLIHHEGKPSETRTGIFKARGATEIINASDAAIGCHFKDDHHVLTPLRSRVLGRPDWPNPIKYNVLDDGPSTHLAASKPPNHKIDACMRALEALPEAPNSINHAVLALGGLFSRATVQRALACLKGGENVDEMPKP